jgi:putative molybdopterin biosynthesis protein
MQPTSFQQSLRLLRNILEMLQPSPEKLSTRAAVNRVLAEAVHARTSNPQHPLAAMDGIAVDSNRVSQIPCMLNQEDWIRINTGEVVPSQFDTVIKIEDVEWEDEKPALRKPFVPAQNVRLVAEDFEGGTLLFPAYHRLQPQDLSLLLTAGYEQVAVFRKPVVTFIPTGSELVLNKADLGNGRIIESNSAMTSALVEAWGGEFRMSEPVEDETGILTTRIKSSLATSDILLISAGTSKGTRDLTGMVLAEIGKVHFHGVELQPARPVIFAEIGNVPVIGLPGYPASAFVASYLYLKPLVCKLSGVKNKNHQDVFISAEEIAAKPTDCYYKVNIFDVDGRVYVRKLPGGAGSFLTLSLMDGLMHVPSNTPIKKRDAVRVDILRDPIPNSLVIRGASHSVILRLFDIFREQNPDDRLLFFKAPSQEALENIVERNCHLAIITTQQDGEDIFPEFASHLQENMLRYRIFTRMVGLVVREPKDFQEEIIRVAVPSANLELWNRWLRQEHTEYKFSTFTLPLEESSLTSLAAKNNWDAVFADIRFLRQGQSALVMAGEHLDLVVSEKHLEFAPVKKLIALLISDSFREQVNTLKGLQR